MLNFKKTTKYKKMWPNDLLVICYFQKYLKQFSSSNIKKVTIFEKTAVSPPKTAGGGVRIIKTDNLFQKCL